MVQSYQREVSESITHIVCTSPHYMPNVEPIAAILNVWKVLASRKFAVVYLPIINSAITDPAEPVSASEEFDSYCSTTGWFAPARLHT